MDEQEAEDRKTNCIKLFPKITSQLNHKQAKIKVKTFWRHRDTILKAKWIN